MEVHPPLYSEECFVRTQQLPLADGTPGVFVYFLFCSICDRRIVTPSQWYRPISTHYCASSYFDVFQSPFILAIRFSKTAPSQLSKTISKSRKTSSFIATRYVLSRRRSCSLTSCTCTTNKTQSLQMVLLRSKEPRKQAMASQQKITVNTTAALT